MSYDKAKLLLEYKETLLKCKSPKTPKEICIENIKNFDTIGFEINDYNKGYIVFIGAPYFAAISAGDSSIFCNSSFGMFCDNHHKSQRETAVYLRRKYENIKFYKFKTHKKLFKWLIR